MKKFIDVTPPKGNSVGFINFATGPLFPCHLRLLTAAALAADYICGHRLKGKDFRQIVQEEYNKSVSRWPSIIKPDISHLKTAFERITRIAGRDGR